MKPVKSRIQNYLAYTLVLATLIILPNLSFDSFNSPKLIVITFGSWVIIGLLLASRSINKKDISNKFSIFLSLFVASLMIPLFFSGGNFWSQFYGTFGRNTGFLAYLSLAMIAFACFIAWSERLESKLFIGMIITSSINILYGTSQWLELDPFKWGNVAVPIFGTFGNVNFFGAFLGISCAISLPIIFDTKAKLTLRIYFIIYILFTQILLLISTSNQGILIFLISGSVVLYFQFVFQTYSRIFSIVYWSFVLFGMGLGTAGILNRGPMSTILFQESTLFRGDYWRAGWQMGINNPLTGVGLDSYGDWWRKFRDSSAYERSSQINSNAAHNVFLDMLASGGIILFVLHIIVFIFVTRLALLNVMRSKENRAQSLALLSGWIAFTVQSLVNINNLGLVVWGWAIMGAIAGRYYKVLEKFEDKIGLSTNQKSSKVVSHQNENYVFIGIPILVVSLLLSIWPLRQDIAFKKVIFNNDIVALKKVTAMFPRNDYYSALIARALLDSKLYLEANEIAKKTLEINSNNYVALEVIYDNPNTLISEKQKVFSKLKFLNPYR